MAVDQPLFQNSPTLQFGFLKYNQYLMKQHKPQQTKYDKIVGSISMRMYEILFFFMVGLTFYGLATLNFNILLPLLLLTIICLPMHGRSRQYIRFVTKYLRPVKFFTTQRIYEEDIPKDEVTLFSIHPHSVYGYGLLTNLNLTDDPEDKLSNMVGLGSRFALNFPLIGFHFKLWGVDEINPANIKRLMKNKKDIGMLPGGFEEATITTPKELRIFIQNRKGFIKYALKYGYTIRPVIILKEHQAFWTLDHFTKFRLFLNKLKMPAVIFSSIFGPFLPPKMEVISVVGKAIRSQKEWAGEYDPTGEEINEIHSQYKEEIERLYDKHKEINGYVPMKFY